MTLPLQHRKQVSNKLCSLFISYCCVKLKCDGSVLGTVTLLWSRTFPGVLGDVDSELDDVSGHDLTRRTLLGASAQTLAVYEGSITALRVLQVELENTEIHTSKTRRRLGFHKLPGPFHFWDILSAI